MGNKWLSAAYNLYTYVLSSPWFMRIAWWGCVGRSWWLLADHVKLYPGANAFWVYTVPFTVLRALITSGLRFVRRSFEEILAAYGASDRPPFALGLALTLP